MKNGSLGVRRKNWGEIMAVAECRKPEDKGDLAKKTCCSSSYFDSICDKSLDYCCLDQDFKIRELMTL
jgi:hypothetical protein